MGKPQTYYILYLEKKHFDSEVKVVVRKRGLPDTVAYLILKLWVAGLIINQISINYYYYYLSIYFLNKQQHPIVIIIIDYYILIVFA